MDTNVMEKLAVTFILNLPDTELENTNRIMHNIEEAMWFYTDYYESKNITLLKFTIIMGEIIGWEKSESIKIWKQYKKYKKNIVRCGGVLLNKKRDKILLVKSFNGNYWGFPVGKINKEEKELDCAKREIFEEINYKVKKPKYKFKLTQNNIKYTLFLFENIEEYFPFSTNTFMEISEIKWVNSRDIFKYLSRDYEKMFNHFKIGV
jgi:mRNA-decapping enzyme subunit 2